MDDQDGSGEPHADQDAHGAIPYDHQMHERAELVVNVVGTGVATLVGTGVATLVGGDVGGQVGAQIGAVLPVVLQHVTAKRTENVHTVAEHACDLAGLDGPELVEWVKASDGHAAYFAAALEAAWETLDAYKVETFSRVLAAGFKDDAKLDTDQLVIRALRDLDAVHVRVLNLIREPNLWGRGDRVWTTQEIVGNSVGLADGIDSIIATLQRCGCIVSPNLFGASGWEVAPFGHRCLTFIREPWGGP